MTAQAAPAITEAHVLVLDDEPDLRTLYELTLLRDSYQVQTAGTVAEARRLLAQDRFDVIITDMRLPDGEGLELLQEMSATNRPERIIVITAYGSAENAVEALKLGAFDYLTKPVDLKQFRDIVHAALAATPTAAPAPTPDPRSSPPEPLAPNGRLALAQLVGESEAMRRVKARIVKVARSMAPALIHGESGTGKELVARAIHACSHRSDGAFVAVNCGAIPENLLEAEFFGARKGSYTGATQDRDGFFQAAAGGTLFLDEIGDLPLSMQVKLLRAIQERKVRALGANQEKPVDVRIVSATHRNLAAEVQAGRFRQDLYYRVNVIGIDIPPLRARREDIPAIAEALLERIAERTGSMPFNLSEEQLQRIQQMPLSGNVRELENLLHRVVALEGSDSVWGGLDPLLDEAQDGAPTANPEYTGPTPPLAMGTDGALPDDLDHWLAEQERQVLLRALHETGFNRTAAAARLGLNLRQIRYRMERLGISEPGNSGASD